MPTLATGLFRYQTIVERNGNYPVLFAGLFMCLLPILIIFIIFSDKMMNGINIGGLKG
jgi:ABC-type glycerol-3-phosphate transport system permease component